MLRDLWPEADHVSDPDGELYERFDVERGGAREMFGWRAWRAGVPAFLAGNRIGSPGAADAWTLPTVVRLRDGEVVARYRGTHAGDHPDHDTMAELIAGPGSTPDTRQHTTESEHR